MTSHTLTFEEIDRGYLYAALVVEKHGPRFLPIFNRMADEREKALAQQDRLAEALKRLPDRKATRSSRARSDADEDEDFSI